MEHMENIRIAVLASILNANEFGDVDLNIIFASGINKEFFEAPAQKTMFEVLKVCYNGDIAYDENIIISYMQKAGIDNPHEIVLQMIMQKTLPQSVLLQYIAELKENYKRRNLKELHNKMAEMFNDSSITAEAIEQIMQSTIDGHIGISKSLDIRTLSDVRKKRKAAPAVHRMPTDIPFIDTVLTDKNGNKGFRNEGLVFISGLKQSGKTYVASKIIENISRMHPVAFGSLEFGEDLYDENVEIQEQDKLFSGNKDNIYTFDDIYETDEIISYLRLLHKLHGIKIAVLDSMLRMTNNNPELKTDERRISEMFSKLGKLSKELKIPIIVIVQSSKEDLKSSMISVKGSMNADHEAYVWFHLMQTFPKDPENEQRTVIWNKNKDTHKHPKQHLMFVPQTSDFYRIEVDKDGNFLKALDKFKKPLNNVIETVYEHIPASNDTIDMPQF